MCGIAGIISADPGKISTQMVKKMADEIAHRGPDGEGTWISGSGLAAFGHRRLSIIDPGPSAAQPMHRAGRYTIVHNGEIYNYIELRQMLSQKGYTFSSHSDTEVILAAYQHYGRDCLQYFDGMFAFGIWDEEEKKLFLARDRMGEKPLFFYIGSGRLLFASEMKSLRKAGVPGEINKRLLFNFLTLGYTQNPGDAAETFYTGIMKLPPRSFLIYHAHSELLETGIYWDIEPGNTGEITEESAIGEFHELLYRSVNRRLRSDAPLGASLSGGLDSSSIVAAILDQAGPSGKLQTWSAVFPGFEKDESAFIQSAAAHFPMDNHQVFPTADGLIRDFEKLAWHQEEPFGSSSIYAQYKVYEESGKQGMKVLLDGQGADEILAGYHKYYHWYWQDLYLSDKKAFRRELQAARDLGIREEWTWKNKLAARFPSFAGIWVARQRAGGQKKQGGLDPGFRDQYGSSYYTLPHLDNLGGILYYNTFMNGLEELLRYADRNSMAHGVEVRLPFLSHELISYVFSLPAHFKIREGWTKWLLRKTMEPVLPHAIAWRRDKTGYEPPQRMWMEHPTLVDYVHEAKKTLVAESVLRPSVLDKISRPQDALEPGNYDWRWLVSAACLFR